MASFSLWLRVPRTPSAHEIGLFLRVAHAQISSMAGQALFSTAVSHVHASLSLPSNISAVLLFPFESPIHCFYENMIVQRIPLLEACLPTS
jgi:hypothetical protein